MTVLIYGVIQPLSEPFRLLHNNTGAARRSRRLRRHELNQRMVSANPSLDVPEPGGASPSVTSGREGWPVRVRRWVAFRNAGALYLLAVMVVVFSVWVPTTFLTAGTWRSLLSDQAITCLVAVGLVIPIAAGVIDLAIGTEVGLGAILVARLLVGSLPIPLAIVLSLMAGRRWECFPG